MADPAATRRPKLAVLDTNVLIHLAENSAPANNLVLRLVRLGYSPVVTQTVIQELAWATEHGVTQRKRAVAKRALTEMLQWGIQPYSILKPVGNGICDVIADMIAARGLLPQEERNDAFILMEASFMGAACLVTWDSHLLDAPIAELNDLLKTQDLNPVNILHPRVFLDK